MSLPETLERSAFPRFRLLSAICFSFASTHFSNRKKRHPLHHSPVRGIHLYSTTRVGACEKHWRDHDAERFCCRKIDTQGELRWFLDRQIGAGLVPLESGQRAPPRVGPP